MTGQQAMRGLSARAAVTLARVSEAREALRRMARRGGPILDADAYEAVSAALYEAERLAGDLVEK